MRKTGPPQVLDQLTTEQHRELHGWLVENLTYKVIRERLKSRFDVAVSVSTLSNYFQRVGGDLIQPTVEKNGAQSIVVPFGWEVMIQAGPPLRISTRPPAR